MRKFNSITHLVRNMIEGRRKSYVFLVAAILCAVFFSAFALMVTYGAITSIQDIVDLRYGRQDYIINNANGLPLDDLVDMQLFSRYGTSKTLGYALFDDTNTTDGFSIAQYDEAALDITNRQLIEGAFPQKEGEIAIESAMLDKLGFDGQVGDTITLTVRVPDGTDFLDEEFEKTYTLTGILYDQYIYQMRWREVTPVYSDIPAAIVSDQDTIEAGGMYITKCYYVFGKGFSHQKIYDLNFDPSSAFEGIYDNLTISSHDFDLGTEDSSLYYLLVNAITFAVLSGALLLASGFGIASAFSAQADERKKQIGMLRAVGATRKQIRSMLVQEILFLSVIAVPAGILLAFLAVNSAKGLIGDVFTFTLNVPISLAIVFFSLVCIGISAILPLKNASQISPMQAIRDTDLSRKMQQRRIRGSEYFNAGRHIAGRTIALHRKRLLPINAFVFIAVLILMVGVGIGPGAYRKAFTNSYPNDFSISANKGYPSGKIVQYGYSSPGISERDRQDAQRAVGNGTVYGDKRLNVNLQLNTLSDYITNYFGLTSNAYLDPQSSDHEGYLKKKETFNISKDFITVECIGVDDAVIENLASAVYAGEINLDKLSSGEEIILVVPKAYGLIRGEDGSVSIHQTPIDGYEYTNIFENDVFSAGDEIGLTLLYTDDADNGSPETSLQNFNRIDNTVKIGALVELDSSTNFPFTPCFMGTVITTLNGFDALGYQASYSSLLMKSNTVLSDSERVYLETELSDIAFQIGNTTFVSNISMFESEKTMAQNILYVIVTLVVLFFSMSVIMINNSVSAHIRSKASMIGTMRAVGATQSDVRKMFIWQLVYMIMAGVVAGVLVSLCIYLFIAITNPAMLKSTNVLWVALALIGYCAALFLICAYNIHKKAKRTLKRSIVATIREL